MRSAFYPRGRQKDRYPVYSTNPGPDIAAGDVGLVNTHNCLMAHNVDWSREHAIETTRTIGCANVDMVEWWGVHEMWTCGQCGTPAEGFCRHNMSALLGAMPMGYGSGVIHVKSRLDCRPAAVVIEREVYMETSFPGLRAEGGQDSRDSRSLADGNQCDTPAKFLATWREKETKSMTCRHIPTAPLMVA